MYFHPQVENYTISDGKTLAHDDIRAVLQFPANYTESMIGRYLGGFTSTEDNVTGSFIDIWVDNSSKSRYFYRIVKEIYFDKIH